VFDQLASNKRRSIVLVALFFVFVLAVAEGFNALVGGGALGLALAAVFTVGSTFASYWASDRVALAMSHATLADETTYARLHNVVEGLCIGAGLPKPRLYVVEDSAPNAFATGRNPKNSAIAVTTGLLEKMNRIELEAVLAHELGHVKNRDVAVATIAVTMVGLAVVMSDWAMRFLWWGGPRHRNDRTDDRNPLGNVIAVFGIVLLVVAPIVAKLMQFAISRHRESLADVTGVSITRYPPGLISALEKLRDDNTVVHSASKATAHLWIESPIPVSDEHTVAHGERRAWFNRLFQSHPPIEDRIAALREL
jgi:heat shock protein HtpX